MREAIQQDEYGNFVSRFCQRMFPRGDVPQWAVEALASVDIHLEKATNSVVVGPARDFPEENELPLPQEDK